MPDIGSTLRILGYALIAVMFYSNPDVLIFWAFHMRSSSSLYCSAQSRTALCPSWEVTFYHFERGHFKYAVEFPVYGMKMRRAMLTEVRVDQDSVKPCNNWHVASPFIDSVWHKNMILSSATVDKRESGKSLCSAVTISLLPAA
ncbi:MAG: hypothetical protein U5J62_11180 [Desulfurivibrio sp.]|nr:hypothetical protein [Desulfurivibrio sp.]